MSLLHAFTAWPLQLVCLMPLPDLQADAIQRAQHIVVRAGGGYDPSKFAPRTYGDASLVPGIAYLPTSKVVRDPAAAQQVLDTGRTRPQDVVVPGTGTAPHMGMVQTQSAHYGAFNPQASFSVNLPGTFQPRQRRSLNLPGTFSAGQVAPVQPMSNRTYMAAPQMRAPGLTNTQGLSLAPTRVGPSFGQPSTPVLQQSGPMAGAYGSSVAGDGTYWEKVSGPTAFGSTVATQVICKRKLPTQTVNPVIGVPVPVPVPVQQGCQTAPVQHGHSAPGRWIH